MRQVVQDVRSGETHLLEVPVPAVRPKSALIRTAVSVVSVGTERAVVEFAGKSLLAKAQARPDLVRQVLDKAWREGWLTTYEAVRNRLDQPLPLGYASAGTVEDAGPGLEGFKRGDRVACAGGGFAVHAEYAVVPRNLLAALPPEVDFESAAFATLGAIALHGFRLGEAGVRDRVAIVGLGLLGMLAAMIARAAGCAVMGVDVDPARVSLARELGFEAVLRPETEDAGAAFTGGRGFDLVQICADTPSDDTVELAGAIARDRGTVISTGVVGTRLPRKPYYEKELRFLISRSYGPGRYDSAYERRGVDYPYGYVRWTEGRNLEAFLELLASKAVDVTPLITHRFPIEQAEEAYKRILLGEETFLGVLLTYPAGESQPKRRRVDLATPPRARAEAQIRLGVIGAGNFATAVLLPAMSKIPGLEWVALATEGGLSAGHVGRRYGFAYATSEHEEILEDERVNTLAVLTRHDLHAKLAVAGLRAGKHVFCEKPLALTQEQLDQVVEALRSSQGMLMVGFNRRFAPHAVRLKSFFEDVKEPLLMHYRVNAGWLPADHWLHDPEQGGGRLLGEACHFIDLLSYLAGEPPQSVRAAGLPFSDRYREDNFHIELRYPDGSLGLVTYLANGDRAVPKERLEVFGGGRTGILDDFRALTLAAGGRKRVLRSRLRQDKGHREEWVAFRDAIVGGGPPPIPYTDLLGVSAAALSALEALRTGDVVPVESFPTV